MGSATHTTDMQHYHTQIPNLWAFHALKTIRFTAQGFLLSADALTFSQLHNIIIYNKLYQVKYA